MKIKVISALVFLVVLCAGPARSAELSELLKDARACTTNEECRISTEFACPLHCAIAINKNADLSELRAYVETIRESIVCEACIEEDVVAVCEDKICVKTERTDDE